MIDVVVLLSTYNGERYLRQQLESLINQKEVAVRILVRDDGSSDGTVKILDEFSADKKLEYYRGNNIGAADSFIDLLFSAPISSFYALCDQDDIWDDDKLSVAVKRLEHVKGPCLYHGFAGRVDENLSKIPIKQIKLKNTFGSALVSSSTGCTMVFNSTMMKLLQLYRPTKIEMHDAWIFRVCYALGAEIIYDPESHMKYRQHNSNVSGGIMSFSEKFHRMMVINRGLRRHTAKELLEGYGEFMDNEKRNLACLLAFYDKSLWKKIKLIFSRDITVNKFRTNVQFKFLILINRM